jgi:hypothetical protein
VYNSVDGAEEIPKRSKPPGFQIREFEVGAFKNRSGDSGLELEPFDADTHKCTEGLVRPYMFQEE